LPTWSRTTFQKCFPKLYELAEQLAGRPVPKQPKYSEVGIAAVPPELMATGRSYEAQPPPDLDWRAVLNDSRPLPITPEAFAYQAAHPELTFRQCYEATAPAADPATPAPPAGQDAARQARIAKYLAKWGPNATVDAGLYADSLISLDVEPGKAVRPGKG